MIMTLIVQSQKRIEKLELVKSASVKKTWGFVVEINISENKPLLFINILLYLQALNFIHPNITSMKTSKNYEVPAIEVIDVVAESGFASSGTPSDNVPDYQDGWNQTW